MIKEAWEDIEIIVNAYIGKLCNKNRFSDAKEIENSRDIVKSAVFLLGFVLDKEFE